SGRAPCSAHCIAPSRPSSGHRQNCQGCRYRTRKPVSSTIDSWQPTAVDVTRRHEGNRVETEGRNRVIVARRCQKSGKDLGKNSKFQDAAKSHRINEPCVLGTPITRRSSVQI